MNNKVSMLFLFKKSGCRRIILFVFLLLLIWLFTAIEVSTSHEWSKEEKAVLSWLTLSSNSHGAVQSAPQIELGYKLFIDKGLSNSEKIACSSCHDPEFYYGDPYDVTHELDAMAPHRAPGLRGVAAQEWFFWDGRADSLWSQALASLENPSEHATTRLQVVQRLCDVYYKQFPSVLKLCSARNLLPKDLMAASPIHPDKDVQEAWDRLTEQQQKLVNELFVLTGKLIAGFVTTLVPEPSRFDAYVKKLNSTQGLSQYSPMTPQEIAGLRLFISKDTGCIDCHNGPLFTNTGFYVIGTDNPNTAIHGRQKGVQTLIGNEFNCFGWEDIDKCSHLKYIKTNSPELVGAYKVPSLRNLKASYSFMHDGRYSSLEEVIEHYSTPNLLPLRHLDIRPLRLFKYQKDQLMAFLLALNETYVCKECYEK